MKLHTLFLGHLISQKPRNPYHQTTTITVTVPVKTLPLECKVRAPVFGSTLAPGDWLGHYCREKVSVTQSCLTLCNPMDCSPPDFSVHGILQARILQWVGMPFSGDLPDLGIEPGSPVLQANSLPSEPSTVVLILFRFSFILTFVF